MIPPAIPYVLPRSWIDLDNLMLLNSSGETQITVDQEGPDLLDSGSGFPTVPEGPLVHVSFDSVDPASTTPLTIVAPGLQVDVSTRADVGPSAFRISRPNDLGLVTSQEAVLYEPSGAMRDTLVLSFSQLLSGIRNLFFTTKNIDNPGTPVTLEAYLGGDLVGTAVARGQVNEFGAYTEGTLSFTGAIFDSIVIHIAAGYTAAELAIGSFDVSLLPSDVSFPLIATRPVDDDDLVSQNSASISGQLLSLAPLRTSLSYVLDGLTSGSAPVSPGTKPSGGTFTFDLSGLTEGMHSLLLEAADQQGNSSQKLITFTVDLTGPNLTVVPFGLDGVIGSSTLRLTGAVADTFRIGDLVRFRLDNGTTGSTLLTGSSDGKSGTFAIDVADLTPGAHSIWIQGSDKAGNLVETVVPFTYDATPPAISATIGRDGFLNSTHPVLTGTVSDAHGVSTSITYSFDGAAPVVYTLDRNQSLTEGLFTIARSGLTEDAHTLQITSCRSRRQQ